jgi:hypothetical protein
MAVLDRRHRQRSARKVNISQSQTNDLAPAQTEVEHAEDHRIVPQPFA